MKHTMIKTTRGFTLIELMIVVAIMGIISMIAYGSYQGSVTKAKRAEAKTTLLELAQKMERCYTANGVYNDATCSVHDGSDLDTTTTEKGHYTLAINPLDATTFTLTATPVLADAECTSFSVNHLGVKTATGTKGNACW